MTFDELFADFRLTADERRSLVWFLATMRARKTIEALLPDDAPLDEDREHKEEKL
jgi:hypothetical protein